MDSDSKVFALAALIFSVGVLVLCCAFAYAIVSHPEVLNTNHTVITTAKQ